MTEYFDVIDDNNKVIGKASRDECHKKGLLHRGIYIIVVNSEGKILMQKRSMKKDLHPGLWTTSVSGHVDSGEHYEQAAKREMMEEIGITAKLSEILKFSFKDTSTKNRCDHEINKIFLTKNNGPFEPNKDEVDKLEFFSAQKILEMIETGYLTPQASEVMKRLIKSPELLKRLRLS